MGLTSNALTLGFNLGLEIEKVTHINPHVSQELHDRSIYHSSNVIKMINTFNSQQETETELKVHYVPICLWSDGCNTNVK